MRGHGGPLITISIGGNDLDFTPVLTDCLKHPDSIARERPIVIRELEEVRRAIPPVLDELRGRAPDARIVVFGYPNFMPTSGDCRPAGGLLHWLLHISSADVEFIHAAIAALNRDSEHIVQGRPNMAYVLPNASVGATTPSAGTRPGWCASTSCMPCPIRRCSPSNCRGTARARARGAAGGEIDSRRRTGWYSHPVQSTARRGFRENASICARSSEQPDS